MLYFDFVYLCFPPGFLPPVTAGYYRLLPLTTWFLFGHSCFPLRRAVCACGWLLRLIAWCHRG